MSEPSPSRQRRILIVEDEPRLRDLLCDVLPDMGFPDPVAVRSGEEALRMLRAETYDILLLDLHLPLMTGMELFEQARQEFPSLQVIILTGFGDLATAQRAIHLDVVEFLSKPFHLSDLESALERARRRLPAKAEEISSPLSPVSTLAQTEYHQIIAALRQNTGNKTAAARQLGISRRKLHYRLAYYRQTGHSIE